MRDGDQMLKQVVEKSTLDADFRRALLTNPKDAISKELDIVIPDSMEVKVHESDLNTVHVALPPDPLLNEEQLEAVSAGLCCSW